MTDREKLVELISECRCVHVTGEESKVTIEMNSWMLADHLIAHGVTVKQMQKPMTVEEVFNSRWSEPNLWIELCEKETLFLMNGDTFTSESYGKTWRCWAEKPTEEERQNAKWEE